MCRSRFLGRQEVAENNESALEWYNKRAFKKLDAAIFMACPVELEPELLAPRELPARPSLPPEDVDEDDDKDEESEQTEE